MAPSNKARAAATGHRGGPSKAPTKRERLHKQARQIHVCLSRPSSPQQRRPKHPVYHSSTTLRLSSSFGRAHHHNEAWATRQHERETTQPCTHTRKLQNNRTAKKKNTHTPRHGASTHTYNTSR
ncbi:unnamed protein product [Ectocarpus sp. 12 AP-2014]